MPSPDGRIGHAEIQIGDSAMMMADEAPKWIASAPSISAARRSA